MDNEEKECKCSVHRHNDVLFLDKFSSLVLKLIDVRIYHKHVEKNLSISGSKCRKCGRIKLSVPSWRKFKVLVMKMDDNGPYTGVHVFEFINVKEVATDNMYSIKDLYQTSTSGVLT